MGDGRGPERPPQPCQLSMGCTSLGAGAPEVQTSFLLRGADVKEETPGTHKMSEGAVRPFPCCPAAKLYERLAQDTF